jgi:hypothetical protein
VWAVIFLHVVFRTEKILPFHPNHCGVFGKFLLLLQNAAQELLPSETFSCHSPFSTLSFATIICFVNVSQFSHYTISYLRARSFVLSNASSKWRHIGRSFEKKLSLN